MKNSLGVILLFGLGSLIVLAISKSLRDFLVGTIGNIISSVATNTYVYDFSNFVQYILANQIGLIWLGSMFILVVIMLVNLITTGQAIR